jgi:dihydrofolate reductase
MKISHVVAASENNAIGLKGKLLWHLPLDMQFFNRTTMGHHVLMGRKSWDSLPAKFRPLPGRNNIVVSRKEKFNPEGCIVVRSIEEGIEYAEKKGEPELMIIGGGEIYKQSLDKTDRIYFTRVHHKFKDADAFYPVLGKEWKELSKVQHPADEKHQYSFDFLVYVKH